MAASASMPTWRPSADGQRLREFAGRCLFGTTPEEVLALDANMVGRLGLVEALGMVRMRGLHAITHYIRRQVADAVAA